MSEEKERKKPKMVEVTGEEYEEALDESMAASAERAKLAIEKATNPVEKAAAKRRYLLIRDSQELMKVLPEESRPDIMKTHPTALSIAPEPGDNPTDYNIMCCLGEAQIEEQLKLIELGRLDLKSMNPEERGLIVEQANMALKNLYSANTERNKKIINMMGGNVDVTGLAEPPQITLDAKAKDGLVLSDNNKTYNIQELKAAIMETEDLIFKPEDFDGVIQVEFPRGVRELEEINLIEDSVTIRHHGQQLIGSTLGVRGWLFIPEGEEPIKYHHLETFLKNHCKKLV